MEELPFGTRGGMAMRSYFPLDGEYEIQVELARRRGREPHQLEVTVDGERKQLVTHRRSLAAAPWSGTRGAARRRAHRFRIAGEGRDPG